MIGYIKGLASVLKRAEKVVAGCAFGLKLREI